jgi:hypothetical protein
MHHLPWREMGFSMGFVLILMALYIGTYYALVEDRVEVVAGRFPPEPYYRFGTDELRPLFRPAHQFDRWCRPTAWLSKDFRAIFDIR